MPVGALVQPVCPRGIGTSFNTRPATGSTTTSRFDCKIATSRFGDTHASPCAAMPVRIARTRFTRPRSKIVIPRP